MSVLAVTGVAREARIAALAGVDTVCSGGSPARLRQLLAARKEPVRAIVSFGIAGGLDPELVPGHAVIGEEVAAETGRWPADPLLTSRLYTALTVTEGVAPVRGSIAGRDVALIDAPTKAEVRRSTGAAVVDMESHIAAEYAAARKLPFAAVRIVCDPAQRGLPPLVNHALTPDGRIALAAVLGSLARQPGQIADLIRLARDANRAFTVLGRCGDALRLV